MGPFFCLKFGRLNTRTGLFNNMFLPQINPELETEFSTTRQSIL